MLTQTGNLVVHRREQRRVELREIQTERRDQAENVMRLSLSLSLARAYVEVVAVLELSD
jgi:hypothetical protein